MGFFGGVLGSLAGRLGEAVLGKTAGIDGKALGQNLGSKFLPFMKGGRVLLKKSPIGLKKGGKVPKKAKAKGKAKAKK